ncbi:MAG: ATP-dependent Clp protease adaptor ClpS [Nitrospirae bacterium]|nr:ATP-dependent Clp protease adaptor ClpS [Nitrospirota bacterium]
MATRPTPAQETAEHTAPREALAPLYHVIFMDDPFTTMEFVVRILFRLFGKDLVTATRLMLEVHQTGSSLVATLPLEVAELKREQVHASARTEGFPFTCRLEIAS